MKVAKWPFCDCCFCHLLRVSYSWVITALLSAYGVFSTGARQIDVWTWSCELASPSSSCRGLPQLTKATEPMWAVCYSIKTSIPSLWEWSEAEVTTQCTDTTSKNHNTKVRLTSAMQQSCCAQLIGNTSVLFNISNWLHSVFDPVAFARNTIRAIAIYWTVRRFTFTHNADSRQLRVWEPNAAQSTT